MKQILFVLKEGQIAFWKYSRGSLARGTLNGNRWNDFAPSYWDEWSEANQAGDLVDAILLSDKTKGFGTLPDWLQGDGDSTHATVCRSRTSSTSSAKSTSTSSGTQISGWTIETLAKLANDAEFSDKGLVLSQGKTKFTLADGDAAECYSLTSSLKFVLPEKSIEKAAHPQLDPNDELKADQATYDYTADVFLLSNKDRKFLIGDKCFGSVDTFSSLRKAAFLRIDGVKDLVKLNVSKNRRPCHSCVQSDTWAKGKKVTLKVVKVEEGRVFFDAMA